VKWYFAIDEAGALSDTGEDAKTAVRTAAGFGQLQPHLLYYGARNEFTAWMQAHGVTVIDAAPAFLDTIQATQAAGIYAAHSIGHWLRVVLPAVEPTADFVLYTDCDVVFLKSVNWQAIRPKVLAAAPEFKKDNWNYFNAGVMVVNIPALRASYPAFEALIRARMEDAGDYHNYDDQFAFNEAYRGHWDRLGLALNWKPYWGFNAGAAVLHFHGPKLRALASIAVGDWHADNATAIQLAKMLDLHLEAYIAWAGMLGDHLQSSDIAKALQFGQLAASLIRYRNAKPREIIDGSFMNFCMFGK
jgi:hypothetical protein